MDIHSFIRSQSGAVTVDWVVMAAAVVGIGIPTVGVVSGGVGGLANGINTSLQNASVAQILRAITDTLPAYLLHQGSSLSTAEGRAAYYQALIDGNVADADDDTLKDLYQQYLVHASAAQVAAIALRQQLSESGTYDYADLSRIITENGGTVVFSEAMMDERNEVYGGNLENLAIHWDLYAPVMGSFSDAYGEELIRRGVALDG